jgi:hypothetical protein
MLLLRSLRVSEREVGEPRADTVRRFIAISDAYEWPSGLTMEHAIGALERELARESRPKGKGAEWA